MKTVYNFEMPHYCLLIDNFKLKDAEIFRNFISGARIGRQICFNSFGNISFEPEDNCHKFATVSYLEQFNRSKTNCMIYDITDENIINDYNKLIVLHYDDKAYHYILLNEETNNVLLQHTISYDKGRFAIRLFESFDSILHRDKYLEQINKLK